MNLVVGATGMVGGEICRLLAARGLPIRALVRTTTDPAKVEALRKLGADIVVGNLTDPASLRAACAGVDALIDTVSSMPFSYVPGQNDIQTVDIEGAKALVDAAKAAGVKRFIYTSFSRNLDLDFPLRNAKRAVEQHLKDSGLDYTILHPGFFMEAWLSPMVGFDAANGKAQIYGTGDQLISWISFKDVAAFAVESLSNPAASRAALEIGGPEAISLRQVIGMFETATGKTFEVSHVPAEALEAQQAGATDPMQQSFIGLMRCYAAGDPIDMRELQQSFAVELTPLKEFIGG